MRNINTEMLANVCMRYELIVDIKIQNDTSYPFQCKLLEIEEQLAHGLFQSMVIVFSMKIIDLYGYG